MLEEHHFHNHEERPTWGSRYRTRINARQRRPPDTAPPT
jgi:hypothetical protein